MIAAGLAHGSAPWYSGERHARVEQPRAVKLSFPRYCQLRYSAPLIGLPSGFVAFEVSFVALGMVLGPDDRCVDGWKSRLAQPWH